MGDLARAHEVPTRLLDLCQMELQEAMNRGWGDADRLKASTLQGGARRRDAADVVRLSALVGDLMCLFSGERLHRISF
jgi:hypothetical protein